MPKPSKPRSRKPAKPPRVGEVVTQLQLIQKIMRTESRTPHDINVETVWLYAPETGPWVLLRETEYDRRRSHAGCWGAAILGSNDELVGVRLAAADLLEQIGECLLLKTTPAKPE